MIIWVLKNGPSKSWKNHPIKYLKGYGLLRQALEAWTNCAPVPIGRTQARKTSEAHPIFWANTFCFVKKKKSFDLQISSQVYKRMKKLQWNKKAWFWDNFFLFQIFQTFGNLEIWFSVNLNICFRWIINTSGVTLFFY